MTLLNQPPRHCHGLAAVILAIAVCTAAPLPVAAQARPLVDPVIATLASGPRIPAPTASGWLAGAGGPVLLAAYRYGNASVEVAAGTGAPPSSPRWGKSNLSALVPGGGAFAGSRFSYALVDGLPSYLQLRSDGAWFAYRFPDDAAIDVAAFILRFNECYAFFERRLPASAAADRFPALVGVLGGVR